MNKIDFDKPVSRSNSGATKWQKYQGRDVIPLWIADSEFRVADPIIHALHDRVEHGVFGYHNPQHSATQAVQRWLKRQYNWSIDPSWLVWMPGVVPAFHVAIETFCQAGDFVIVQSPNYPPILSAATDRGVETLQIGTELKGSRWQLDFAALERACANPKAKLFLLCNPMNPCGTVYTEQELQKIEALCLKHDVQLCSDEIHADLILNKDVSHIPAGTLSKIGEQAITLMAASKTFNVAGFGVSFAIIRDPAIRSAYKRASKGICPSANNLGVIATTAAFTLCDDWYEQQLDYLRDNQAYLARELNQFKEFNYVVSDATYLAWVDCSNLAVENIQTFMESAGVGPSPGADFGWPKFSRFNFACPRAMLEQAVARLKAQLT